jgi:hypothetical protein
MSITTRVKPISAPKGPMMGIGSSQAAMVAERRAPPKAPARMPTRVMPTCTVGRNRCGSSASAMAAAAPALPLRCIAASLVRRAETMANSLIAKAPFSRRGRGSAAIRGPRPSRWSSLIVRSPPCSGAAPPLKRHSGARSVQRGSSRRAGSAHIAAMNRPLPSSALLLGAAGLIPFLGLAAASMLQFGWAPPPWPPMARPSWPSWAPCIGAWRCGPRIRNRARNCRAWRWACCPPSSPWVALLLPLRPGLALLAVAILATAAAESRAAARGLVPPSYMRLRWALSAGAAASLGLGALVA